MRKDLRILVTSRSVLHLSEEQDFDVPPLGIPDPAHLPSPDALSQYEAVALFIERASAAKPGFAVTNENAPAVAEICSRLDGLPLAIELAAARIRVLSPRAILDRLERRLPLLTGGARDRPDRQRTLRDAIDWSYELLDDAERALFDRLAVFAGGWTLEMAEAVCNPDGELQLDLFEGMSSLTDKSLIRPMQVDSGEDRFTMLQVLREFAAERLDAGPDSNSIRRRHALEMAALTKAAEPELVRTQIRSWQLRLRQEEENIRGALRWAIELGEAELALRIAGPLWQFWTYWLHVREGIAWLEAVLALPGAAESIAPRARRSGRSRHWNTGRAGPIWPCPTTRRHSTCGAPRASGHASPRRSTAWRGHPSRGMTFRPRRHTHEKPSRPTNGPGTRPVARRWKPGS